MSYARHRYRPYRCCRNPERGILLGVCAGVAECFDWPLWLTRVVVFLLGWIFTVPTLIGYGLAALLLPEPPRHHRYRGYQRTRDYSRHYRS